MRKKALQLVTSFLSDLQGLWKDKFYSILTADYETQESETELSLVNKTLGFARVRFRITGKSKQGAMLKYLRQRPLIQLSQYEKFTDTISAAWKKLIKESAEKIRERAAKLIEGLYSDSSPWFDAKPLILEQTGGPGLTEVSISLDVKKFTQRLITLCLEELPSLSKIRQLHKVVPFGSERSATREKIQSAKLRPPRLGNYRMP